MRVNALNAILLGPGKNLTKLDWLILEDSPVYMLEKVQDPLLRELTSTGVMQREGSLRAT